VYSDVDVLLESKLDMAIDDDVGFMIPLDSPGKESGHQICLWSGFIASAPGHPFLAAVIETVVNNIRNRFTSVDIMHSMCPGEVDFFVLHRYDILFTSEYGNGTWYGLIAFDLVMKYMLCSHCVSSCFRRTLHLRGIYK